MKGFKLKLLGICIIVSCVVAARPAAGITIISQSANTDITLGYSGQLEFENPLSGTETVQGYAIIDWRDADYNDPPPWYDDWSVSHPGQIDGSVSHIWMRTQGHSIWTSTTLASTTVSIHMDGDDNDGLAQVIVDGIEVARLDMLTPPGPGNALIIVKNLPYTPHTITINDLGVSPGGTLEDDVSTLGAAALRPVKWFGPFWFLNARLRLVWTPGWVTFPTGYWGGWYWWYYQNYWFYPWCGPMSWYWPYCYQYPYWAYWDYWPYYRYYHPWWHYWNWGGWPYFWGFNDRLTFRYWWWRPRIVYWWSYYWDPAGQGNCLDLVTMSDEDNPAGGRILPLDPNVINHLEVQSHQFSVNGGKVEGDFSQLYYIPVSDLEHYYRNMIPGVTEDEVQTFINSDIVKELMKNDPCGTGQVGVQYAQWQHPVSPLTVSPTSLALPEGSEVQYIIGLRDPSPVPVTVRVVSSKPEDLLIRCPDGSWAVESFFDVYYEMPQTVTIMAVDDTFSEGEETVMLANFLESDPNNGFPLAVTIQDDECGGKGYHEADLNHDCKVNFYDFAIMADGWLSCTDPGQ